MKNDWLVVHYKKKRSVDIYEFEFVVFPKINYGLWFEKEKAKVKVTVLDPSYLAPE